MTYFVKLFVNHYHARFAIRILNTVSTYYESSRGLLGFLCNYIQCVKALSEKNSFKYLAILAL